MQAAWMLVASLLFAGMSACVKFASPAFDSLELVGYRGIVGMLVVGGVMRVRGMSLRTRVPGMHLWRNVIGVSAMSAWFYAIAHLPLATALTLNYMSSVWIATFIVLGIVLLRQRGSLQRLSPLVVAVALGFAGVIMVLGPTFEDGQLGAGLVGLAGGLMAGLALMQVASLGRVGEPETRTVFYYSLSCTLVGLAWAILQGAHSLLQPAALWLLPMGILGALAQLSMTRAYTHGATIVVASLQYSTIVFGALLGLTLFGDRISPLGWLGIATIIASGVASTALRARAKAP